MNDTSDDVERLVRQRYLRMTGEERFLIGLQMFETARIIVLSSLPEHVTPGRKRRFLCKRFYGELATEAYPETNGGRDLSGN